MSLPSYKAGSKGRASVPAWSWFKANFSRLLTFLVSDVQETFDKPRGTIYSPPDGTGGLGGEDVI